MIQRRHFLSLILGAAFVPVAMKMEAQALPATNQAAPDLADPADGALVEKARWHGRGRHHGWHHGRHRGWHRRRRWHHRHYWHRRRHRHWRRRYYY